LGDSQPFCYEMIAIWLFLAMAFELCYNIVK
jgi:hypothetical protein